MQKIKNKKKGARPPGTLVEEYSRFLLFSWLDPGRCVFPLPFSSSVGMLDVLRRLPRSTPMKLAWLSQPRRSSERLFCSRMNHFFARYNAIFIFSINAT